MTPTPDMTRIARELYGTLTSNQIVYIDASPTNPVTFLLCAIPIVLVILGLISIILWEKQGKQ